MTTGSDIAFFTALFATLWTTVFSIKCLQCTSLVDRDCSSGNVPAKQCDRSVDFCIKYVGELSTPTDVVVFRDCNKQHMDNVCLIRMIENQRVRVCYETCNKDGCNNGPVSRSSVQPHGSHVVTTCLLTFISVSFVYLLPILTV